MTTLCLPVFKMTVSLSSLWLSEFGGRLDSSRYPTPKVYAPDFCFSLQGAPWAESQLGFLSLGLVQKHCERGAADMAGGL